MWPFRKSAPPKPAPLSLDEALVELGRLGIVLRAEANREAFLGELGLTEGEPVDRVDLLCVLGSEFPDFGNFSDDIWHVDAECIEDHNAYIRLAHRFTTLSKGALPLTRLRDYVDVEGKEAWFEYQLEGRTVRWDLEVSDDWMDPAFYLNFQRLLASRSSARFMITALGQDSLILCGDDHLRQAISKFAGLQFQWQ